MSLYYIVKIIYGPRETPSYLGHRSDARGQPSEHYGVCQLGFAKRFLWKEEAYDALRQFMSQCEHPRIHYGQVFHVTEKPWGDRVGPGEAPPTPSEPASASEEVPRLRDPLKIDIEEGEALLAAYEDMDVSDRPKRVMEARHAASDWFFGNALEIFETLRLYERINWLRMNPESCRAKKDCRRPRKEGYIHCEECLNEPNAGGYFDVYRRYYVQQFNEELETMIRDRFAIQVATPASRPESPDSLPDPE